MSTQPAGDQGSAGNDPADAGWPRSRPRMSPGARAAVDGGAGWVLGVLLWGWVVAPFVKGGPAQVRKTLKAKFLNKAPDGSWLP